MRSTRSGPSPPVIRRQLGSIWTEGPRASSSSGGRGNRAHLSRRCALLILETVTGSWDALRPGASSVAPLKTAALFPFHALHEAPDVRTGSGGGRDGVHDRVRCRA